MSTKLSNYEKINLETFKEQTFELAKQAKEEFGSRANLGFVLLSKDKTPKQIKSNFVKVSDKQEIDYLNHQSTLPERYSFKNGTYYKEFTKTFWGKKTDKAIEKILSSKENSDIFGIGTGEYYTVVDIDTKNINSNTPSLKEIEASLSKTFIIETPSGGKHYYFLNKKGKQKPISSKLPCIDILGKGKLVVAPLQEIEGKGNYKIDFKNTNFSTKVAYWDESIRTNLNKLFSNRQQPTSESSSIVVSATSRNSSRNPNFDSIVFPDYIKSNTRRAMRSTKFKIEQGDRFISLFYYLSLIADSTPKELLLQKANLFNLKFNPPLEEKEIQKLVKYCIAKFGCYNGKSKSDNNFSIQLNHKAKQNLMNLLAGFKSTETFEISLKTILPLMQTFLSNNGMNFKSTLASPAAGKYLLEAGFKSKNVRVNGKVIKLWNTPASLVTSLLESSSIVVSATSRNSGESVITSVVELGLDNTTHLTSQIQEQQQEISLTLQESNQDTQMTIHTQEQKECPAEPSSEFEIPSDQVRLQEIELELTTITNSKELSLKEKKELYSAVALKINSKDLSKISKNLLNFIPSEDYRKICRR